MNKMKSSDFAMVRKQIENDYTNQENLLRECCDIIKKLLDDSLPCLCGHPTPKQGNTGFCQAVMNKARENQLLKAKDKIKQIWQQMRISLFQKKIINKCIIFINVLSTPTTTIF